MLITHQLLVTVLLILSTGNAAAFAQSVEVSTPRMHSLEEGLASHGLTDLSKESLIAALSHSDPQVRTMAAMKLAQDHHNDAAPAIGMSPTRTQIWESPTFTIERIEDKAPRTLIYRIAGTFIANDMYRSLKPVLVLNIFEFTVVPGKEPPTLVIFDLTEVPSMDPHGRHRGAGDSVVVIRLTSLRKKTEFRGKLSKGQSLRG